MPTPTQSDRLRILNLSEMYPPGYGGGASAYVVDGCRLLAARGHSVAVVCTESRAGDPYTVRETHDGTIRVFRINLPYFVEVDPEGWGLGWLRWRRHQKVLRGVIAGLVRAWNPNLVLCHLPRPLGEDFVQDLHDRGLPIIWTLHDAWSICMRLQLIRSPRSEVCSGPQLLKCLGCTYTNFEGSHLRAAVRLPWRILHQGMLPAYRTWRRRRLRRLVSGAVGYSRYIASVHALHLPRTEYIPLGINLEGLPPIRPVRPRVPLRFGFVAGYAPHKGLDLVLEAATNLKREGFAFELHVWGPGQAGPEHERAQRELSDRFRFHGVFEPSDRWRVYGEIDVAVMATTWAEPFGRVVGEAAAMGAPTIAPSVGGLTEQIRHGEDGLLFRFRDRMDLEAQMRRVLTERGLFQRLAAGLRPVRDTRDAVVDLEAYYMKIMAISDR